MTTPRPLIYAAHPMTTYGTDLERAALARIGELVPTAKVVDPAVRYRDSAHWLIDWPKLLPTLAALVVFGDVDGTIGTGCLHELVDAWWQGVPVGMLDDQGLVRRVSGLRLLPDVTRDNCHTAFLVPGRQANLSRLAGTLRSSGTQR